MMDERSCAPRRTARRGFTLVELLVSLTAGLLIAAAAFLLARNASTFFQREAGMTTAQFASVIGMARLQGDLRLAAFMSSPNPRVDPLLCGDVELWPIGMNALAGITIVEGGSRTSHEDAHGLSVENNLTPDALILAGSFATTEQFAVAVLSSGAGDTLIQLQEDGAMRRTRLAAGATFPAKIASIFAPGRYLRIVDEEGRIGFGIITGVQPGPPVTLSLAANPQLPTRNTNGLCGCQGFCTGALVNPVSRVLYDLRRIDPVENPGYAALYQKGFHEVGQYHRGTSQVARTELVRVELDANGDEIPGTLELVAEYAVDLKFGLTVEVPQNPPAPVPQLTRFPVGDPNVYLAARAPPVGTPERIRAVQVRFSTRPAEKDREVGLTPASSDGGLYRYSLGQGRGYSRMRTLVTDVALPNQARMP